MSEPTKVESGPISEPPIYQKADLSASPGFWRESCLALSCLLVLTLLLYWSTARDIIAQWRTSAFSHGFLVIPTCLYLAWAQRDRLKRVLPRPVFWALPLLAVFSFFWLLGKLSGTDVLQQFCLVGIFIILVWGALGNSAARALLMPLGFLLFAIPIGVGLTPSLQDFSAWLAVRLLEITRIPVLLEGHIISVPSGKWEVAEACSGLRYLTTSTAIGFVFAGLMYRTWTRRIAFLLACVVVPIMTNGLRVFLIVLLAYVSGNRIAAGADHVLYGWILFTVVTVLLLSGSFWREKPGSKVNTPDWSTNPKLVSTEDRAAAIVNVKNPAHRITAFGLLAAVALVLAPVSNHAFWNRSDRFAQVTVSPIISEPWQMVNKGFYGWTPTFHLPDTEWFQSYESPFGTVKLYLAYYATTQPGAKLVGSGNTLFDRHDWESIGESRAIVTLQGRPSKVHETLIRSAQHTLVLWNWYSVDEQSTSSETWAKLLWTKARFMRDRRAAVAVVVATEDLGDSLRAPEVLRDFSSHMGSFQDGSQFGSGAGKD